MSVVAERAALSQQMVSYVEKGARSPTLGTMLRLAEALDVNLSDVLAEAERSSQDHLTAVRVASKKVGATVDRMRRRGHP
jgi:transcriptional regulator with XRE-family HTH domain